MRLIDADEVLHDLVGMKDGWLKPPKKVLYLEDLIKVAPTIDPCSSCPYKNDRPSRPPIAELG